MEHPVWKLTHFRVAAFAGVSAFGLGQGAYLFEGPEDCPLDGETARGAADYVQVKVPRPQFPCSARRADDVAQPGCGA
jgi:hypothetical protein